MDKEYPLYLRYQLNGDDIPTDTCPGQSCDGTLTKDSGLLKASTWTCDTCGVTYEASRGNRTGCAAISESNGESVAQRKEYRDGNYVNTG